MKYIKKNFNLILKNYILFILILTIFYLSVLNPVKTYNAMAEWVINYQGGFVRRGLIGELVFKLSNLLNLNLRFTFFILQSILYIIYYYLIYDLLKKLKYDFFFLLAILSPLFIIFPIAELEAIGRKEVLIFIILLTSINLYFRFLNNNLIIFFISIFFPIIILTFEASIFYSFYFISLILVTSKKIDFFYLSKLFIFSIPSLASIYLIYFYPHSKDETLLMCEVLKNIGEECGMPTFFLSKNINAHISEVDWQPIHIFRYILIFIFGFLGIFFLIINSKFNKELINPIFLKFPLSINFLLMFLPTISMYFIAVDTGRWTHIVYTCTFIYYFSFLKNHAIILNERFYNLNIFKKKNSLLKIVIIIFTCLSWNPKAVYHEDLGSFPIYRSIEKIPDFIGNLKDFRVVR